MRAKRGCRNLAAWQAKLFELPDYYLVMAPDLATPPARNCTWGRCEPRGHTGCR